ncbi:MAG: cytidylate kinase-like family protein [Bacillota bacterium]|jgi:cytidylate kinase|nr:cytidylate kinase-like family protein [Bacillota bacterium]NLM07551.1 cytidylate kinase-like family protein [Clostridiales Family XIII bacterium]
MSGQIIVTISTQPGCGGAEIGQRLARRMPAVYVDKRLVAKVASGLDAVIENSDDTKTKSKFWELLGQTPILTNIESYIPEIRSVVSDAEVHEKEGEILLKLVGKNTAVAVGRAGFYRFREHPRLVKVFLGGDWQYRHDNYKRFYGLSDEDAEDLLRTTDQATERYIYKVTGKDMLDIRNYDLSFNVSKIDFNVVVNLILDYVHYRFQ